MMKGYETFQDTNLLLIMLVCVGLVLCSVLFFREDIAMSIGGEGESLNMHLGNVTYSAFHDAVRRVAYTLPSGRPWSSPTVTPIDAVTGATPRIIGWINDVIRRSKPAVVGICVGDTNQAPPWQQGWEIVSPMGRRSVGSGVIVHPDGYVVTNCHVVELAGNIVISVFEGKGFKDYPAELIVAKKQNDLALLRIVTHGNQVEFPYLPFADSDKIAVGDKVIAIGNPFGFSQTTTSGIVSARRRSMPIGNITLQNIIQTDVPINPGNSGGALLNLKGEVVGINTAIFSPVESVYTGISFAIPSNHVKNLFANYVKFAVLSQMPPWNQPVGFQFTRARPGMPVPSVGAVSLPRLMQSYGYAYPTGVAPSPLGTLIQPSPGEGIEELAWLGIDLVPESDEKTNVSEVVVDEVEGISPMEAGLEAGDIIRAVNGYPTPNIYDFKEVIKKIPLEEGQGVVIDVYRPRTKETLFVGFRMKRWDLVGR